MGETHKHFTVYFLPRPYRIVHEEQPITVVLTKFKVFQCQEPVKF